MTGRPGTARRGGSGKRDEKVYERNQWVKLCKRRADSNLVDLGLYVVRARRGHGVSDSVAGMNRPWGMSAAYLWRSGSSSASCLNPTSRLTKTATAPARESTAENRSDPLKSTAAPNLDLLRNAFCSPDTPPTTEMGQGPISAAVDRSNRRLPIVWPIHIYSHDRSGRRFRMYSVVVAMPGHPLVVRCLYLLDPPDQTGFRHVRITDGTCPHADA
jgi:hypothetical protein